MPLAEMLLIAGALSAPAFFLIFALASLGSPLLAMLCLAVSQLRSTQYIEAYARRLLRMALTAALPALLAFAVATALAARKAPWMVDWVHSAPLGPGLFVVSALAFFASLLTLRQSRPAARHGRQSSPLTQAFILSLLAIIILCLSLALTIGLMEQAQAVLQAPTAGGISVAPLIPPDASALPPFIWAALAALVPLCIACASVMSQEYILMLRDRDPFGREALAQMLRIASRSTLRSTLLAMAFLPMIWLHLAKISAQPGVHSSAQLLLVVAGACSIALCFCAGMVTRSSRPWANSLAIHLEFLALWMGLTALLSIVLFNFYAA
ncbi:MAG: hypothetical protein Q8O35_13140 [Humidesulfovibrio sp.]|uniref:hypothetical protein n=1 Tax=Humidesulfovibrio sp. TaxID=2910988 RepID=UPI00273604C1|nr:hypothetical protein [Humidesulfovibrio sp.]MDP2849117.1 hypothetical protein [Humidesulfovibrio sp.]